MVKIIFEFNGCTYGKFLLVEYKVEKKKWNRKFGLPFTHLNSKENILVWVKLFDRVSPI